MTPDPLREVIVRDLMAPTAALALLIGCRRRDEAPPTCDEIAERLHMPEPKVRRALVNLEREGHVRRLGRAANNAVTWEATE